MSDLKKSQFLVEEGVFNLVLDDDVDDDVEEGGSCSCSDCESSSESDNTDLSGFVVEGGSQDSLSVLTDSSEEEVETDLDSEDSGSVIIYQSDEFNDNESEEELSSEEE